MIPFTTSLCFGNGKRNDRTAVPGLDDDGSVDWRVTSGAAASDVFRSQINLAQPASSNVATQESQIMMRPNTEIRRNSRGILEIRIRRDIPIISPKEGNVLPMAPLTEGRIVPQRSIAEEPEQCGRPVISGRFFSLHKNYQRRRSRFKFTKPENGVLVDETYQGPATCLLQHIGNWNFNTFTLDHLTNGRALFHLGVHLFEDYGLISHFKLDHMKLMKCFGLLEASYHSTNPFHNSVHAADVTQALNCVMQQHDIQKHLSKLEIMGALLAAAGHDVDHPGVNQPFLVSTRNYLAALYNNRSVLENHHWRTSICLIRQSGVFDGLSPEDHKGLEDIMKTMILATDITRQPDLIAKFRQLNDEKSFGQIMEDTEERQFVLQIILKCADINNPCRPWAISRIWSQRCVQEFFKQGDRERRLNLPVTAICDRKTNNLPRIQVGFIDYVVAPLFREWERFHSTALTVNMTKNLKVNLEKWQNLAKEYTERQAAIKPPEVISIVPQSTGRIGLNPEDIKGWTSELPTATIPLFQNLSRKPVVPGTKRRHSLPISLTDKRARTSLHREQLSGPRSRRHSVFSETIVRFSTSGDPFVDRVSFSVEPTYSATEPHGGSWSTEDIAPRMSRITSLTCDAEVSRISTAVAADTDSEIDEIGPVFAREDSMESEGSRRLRSRISQSFEEEEEEEPSLTELFVPPSEAEEEEDEEEEENKENTEAEPREATLYYDLYARGPKYFERKIKEEDEHLDLSDTDLEPAPRRRSKAPHPGVDPASAVAVLGKRRSVPPFLCLFPNGMTSERLILRRRSEPIAAPPFAFHLGGNQDDDDNEEEAEAPPASRFQRRRGSEPVDVLSASRRAFLGGLHQSISASSVPGLDRPSSRSSDTGERRRRSGNSSPGGPGGGGKHAVLSG